MPDEFEARLTGDFLFGDRFSEADFRSFVFLVRFDAAYQCVFTLNCRRIADCPRLAAYLKHILGLPCVRETVALGAHH